MRRSKKPEHKDRYTLHDIALMWAKETGEDKNVFKAVIEEVLWNMNRSLIVRRFDYIMGHRLGKITIEPAKVEKEHRPKILDWQNTRLHKKFIHRVFLLTEGYVYRFKWVKGSRRGYTKNANLYGFRINQDVVRREIGKCGLYSHVSKMLKDPYLKPFERI